MPAPGRPLFQAATANLTPRTEATVDTAHPQRGPLLIISGEKDHTVPWAIANASYKRQAQQRRTRPRSPRSPGGALAGHRPRLAGGRADSAFGFLATHGVTAT